VTTLAITRRRWLSLGRAAAFLAWSVVLGAEERAPLPRGTIFASAGQGEAMLVTGAGRTPLVSGAAVPMGAAVVTARGARVKLTLSNGAIVSLGAESELAVQEFFQEPGDTAVAPRGGFAAQEPSVAHVKLLLLKGEVLGRVPRLRATEGSRFAIATPAGEIVLQPESRQATVTSSTPLAAATLAAFQAHGLRVGAGDGATVFRVGLRRTAPRRATLELGNGGGAIAFVVRGAAIAVPDQREITLEVNLPR
jgi:hypothetical protein